MVYSQGPRRTPLLQTAQANTHSSGPLRLERRDPVLGTDHVHGGWWPHSRDLSAELPDLLDSLLAIGYDARRVMYGSRGWDDKPRGLMVSGRLIKLAGYYSQQAATLVLTDVSGGRPLTLLVVPHDMDPQAAARAMELAALDGDERRVGEILEQAIAGDDTPHTSEVH